LITRTKAEIKIKTAEIDVTEKGRKPYKGVFRWEVGMQVCWNTFKFGKNAMQFCCRLDEAQPSIIFKI